MRGARARARVSRGRGVTSHAMNAVTDPTTSASRPRPYSSGSVLGTIADCTGHTATSSTPTDSARTTSTEPKRMRGRRVAARTSRATPTTALTSEIRAGATTTGRRAGASVATSSTPARPPMPMKPTVEPRAAVPMNAAAHRARRHDCRSSSSGSAPIDPARASRAKRSAPTAIERRGIPASSASRRSAAHCSAYRSRSSPGGSIRSARRTVRGIGGVPPCSPAPITRAPIR